MAKPTKKRWIDYLWIVSATYFTLGFFNIVFAWLGVICFLIPLLMAPFGHTFTHTPHATQRSFSLTALNFDAILFSFVGQ